MASSIPSQSRAVDPFASYNSDTVNTLTRMLTYGENGLATAVSCDVIDSTSNTEVILKPGFVYKDDMWIYISANHIVDFTDPAQYSSGFMNEIGYYYIVLDYTFVKSRPAPQAKALIVKPSQITDRGGILPDAWLFLKAVKVEWTGSEFVVVSVHNYDPGYPNNKRRYISTYTGAEIFLPTFSEDRDKSRMVYDIEEDQFYFGYSNRWESAFGSVSFPANTLGFTIGELVYVDSTSGISSAIATAASRTADGVVSKVSATGVVKTSGKVENVKIDSTSNINVGDIVYLSKTEAGKITENRTPQFVGKCVEIVDANTVNILFHRGEPTSISVILPAGVSWTFSGGLYYQDIDISDFGSNIAFEMYDTATRLIIIPSNIEFVSSSIARIWMPNNTVELNVTIIG